MELANILQQLTLGSAGIWTGVLMLGAWLLKEWRETRKLSADDRLARRDGYAKQVEVLLNENRNLGNDMRALRQEYDNYRHLCHQETDELRNLIIRLQGEIAGYKRRLDMQALELADIKGHVEEGRKDG